MTSSATVTGPGALPLRESADIQGDILAGFKKDHVSLLFLQFEDAARARSWLAELAPRIATTRQVAAFNERFSQARRTSGGDDPEALNATWLGVSLTYPGLRLLSGRADPLPAVPTGTTLEAFVHGAAARARALGDIEDSATDRWLFGHEQGRAVHAVLTLASDTAEGLQQAIDEQREAATRAAALLVFQQNAATLTGERRGKEHFGFKDGVSEPGVRGFDEEDPQRPGYVRKHPGTRLIPPGEFLIGRPRVQLEGDRRRFPAEAVPPWMNDGSFQVIRRLAQDVPGWWAQVGDQLQVLKRGKNLVPQGATVEWLAARMVGRWRSGAPVHKCPTHDPVNDRAATSDNDISYRDDPDGLKTPLFSHLRQCAPRDGLLDGEPVPEQFMDARRIIRRGAPYGQPFDPARGTAGGPDAARGLLFVSYQADLVEQFEFIQKAWVNTSDFPPGREHRPGPDAMISGRLPESDEGGPALNDGLIRYESANSEGTGRQSTPLALRRFVRTEGAVYAFAPSISTLKALAEGRLDGHTPTTARIDEIVAVPDQYRVGGVSRYWLFQQDRQRGIVVRDDEESTDLVLRPSDDLANWPALAGVRRVDAVLPVPDRQRVGGKSWYWIFHTTGGTQLCRTISIADGERHVSALEEADRALSGWRSLQGVAHLDAVLPVPDRQRVGGESLYWVFHTPAAAGGSERQLHRIISVADGTQHTDTLVRADAELTTWSSLAGIDKVDAFLPVPALQRAAGKSHFWVFHRDGVRTVSIADGARHTDTLVGEDRALGQWVNLG
ncbi:Dyp-type peroxidase [Actinospica durhamensis]|uniref:Dyp-type peroxidase n=1 Tax=Actinospica durhamensis TaxID=1508375 RepID=A0A941IM32_9ACTN|nr:Dyp-type peroxidase [Actinospica durhamensis]MBR7833700.1 Dyp-type peroxidase [Actinospica durhamensis]